MNDWANIESFIKISVFSCVSDEFDDDEDDDRSPDLFTSYTPFKFIGYFFLLMGIGKLHACNNNIIVIYPLLKMWNGARYYIYLI